MKYEVKILKSSVVSGVVELEAGKSELEALVNKNNHAKCIKDSPINILLNQGTLEETGTIFGTVSCIKLIK